MLDGARSRHGRDPQVPMPEVEPTAEHVLAVLEAEAREEERARKRK